MCKRLGCLILVWLVLGACGQALAGIKTAEELLVDLRAEDLPYGSGVTTWINHGTLDDFTAVGNPVVEDVDGRKAVTFDEPSFFQGPLSPEGIYGNGTRSIEVWVYNGTNLVGEETMVSWSHRGGPDGTNIGFNYGNHTTWGAVGHWGAADMPWSDPHAPAPEPLNWWHLVYTYDGSTVRLYVNGQENTVRNAALNTHGPNIIRVAAQADGTGAGAQSGLGFTGSIAEVRIHDGVLSPEDIAYNFVIGDLMAKDPRPANGESDVRRDVMLEWSPGDTAVTHDVYFGTDLDSVTNASRTSPMGVLASQGQTGITYDPGVLDLVTTYYWRVDEVNAAPDNTIYKGDTWSFTTESYAYPITSVEATTNGVSDPGSEAINTVNGSGLNASDQHSTDTAAMWLATPPVGESLWLQCAFDKVYKLNQLQVWNHNTAFEAFLGFGAKDVTIEYSVDGDEWMTLGDYVFQRATGTNTYTANTTIDLEGVAAQYVRLVLNSAYGAGTKIGLSEVRFLYLPVQARGPQPADGAVNVDVDTDLTWRAGRDAAMHDIYLDTTDGTTLVATTEAAGYEPGTLDLGTTYYWKVDEVNNAEATSVWEGLVWSFSTQDSFLIEDFEAYDDDIDAGTTIWQTWIDGIDDPSNGGAVVGYDQSPFAEQDIVYAGGQAMPLRYNNTSSPYYSEADRTFSTPQNWAKAGITTLVIHFRGDFDNAVNPIYAVVNGTRVDYDGGADIISLPIWKQWNIDLTGIPNLQNVRTLSIGVGGGSPGGTGILYVDSIRLYREAPESATPTDPGTDGLGAYYAFEGNLNDSSGNGYNGTAMDSEVYDDSPFNNSQALSFDGINDYAELPIGPLVASADSMTVATWYNMLPNVNNWQRIFDFGTSNTEGYMFLCPQQGTSGAQVRFAITATAGGTAESVVNVPGAVAEGWHHVAVVIDGDTMNVTLYLDGAAVATGETATLPSGLGQTTQNWLGRSQYEADGYFLGLLDEFRIYTEALSAGEIRYLAGDR